MCAIFDQRRGTSPAGGQRHASAAARLNLMQSAVRVVLQTSILTQIRHLVLYISNSDGSFDGFVGELTSAKRLRLCVSRNSRHGGNTEEDEGQACTLVYN